MYSRSDDRGAGLGRPEMASKWLRDCLEVLTVDVDIHFGRRLCIIHIKCHVTQSLIFSALNDQVNHFIRKWGK